MGWIVRRVQRGLVDLAGLYVVMNLVVVGLVPVVVHCALEVDVVDDATGAPVPGARVGCDPPWGRLVGTTGAAGHVETVEGVGASLLWAWPYVGSCRIGETLHVEAAGYAPQDVALPASIRLPWFGDARVSVAVRMSPGPR